MIRQFFSREFTLFIIAGGIAAVVNFIARIIFNQYFDFSKSVLLAYLIGMATAFILTKIFVFNKSKIKLWQSAMLFIFINSIAIAQTWAICMGLNYYVLPSLGISYYAAEIASAIGIMFPVLTSYLGHKHLSFK